MKIKSLSILCALALGMAGATPALASGHEPGAIVVDTVLVRPLCFGVTLFGSAFFVVSLPVSAVSKSVHSTAKSMVTKPAAATFTRPLGDLDALRD